MSNSISPLMKGNAPLITFSFSTDSGQISPIPSNPSKYTVYVHDSAGVRTGAGTIQGINTTTGICQYQASPLDTANAGIVTWWTTVDLGEPVPRTFDPQRILVEDPSQA